MMMKYQRTTFAAVLVMLGKAAHAIAASAETDDRCDCVYGDGQFCGSDGRCYLYSCPAWYNFGPETFTGNDGGNNPLACQDIPITEDFDKSGFYPSVSLRCISLTPRPIVMGFTRRCSATPGPYSTSVFTCYELAANTDFQPLLDKATLTNLDCNDTKYNETGGPEFTYSVTAEAWRGVNSYLNFPHGFSATKTLNTTRALTGTMYAFYDEGRAEPPTGAPIQPPTPSPITPSPITPSPITPTSNALLRTSTSVFLGPLFLSAGAAFLCL